MIPDAAPVYSAETNGLIVRVVVSYVPHQSQPPRQYVWAYMVEIENASARPMQLLSRRWIITDGQGRIEEVEGPGVVGEQPVIGPGEVYQYTSGCPLPTPTGSMVGTYRMRIEDGGFFDAAIPAFSLDLPGRIRTVN
ncbi:MAG: Co2+/Mg2+ efflux protein ApaG [Caulobacteraceae bacterium]|nr:Co2+/Mg2+ efflux protein ApaG [Caulobacteraceae bacterium]